MDRRGACRVACSNQRREENIREKANARTTTTSTTTTTTEKDKFLPEQRGKKEKAQQRGPVVFGHYMASSTLVLLIFLDASTHLCKNVCPSICWSVTRFLNERISMICT